MRPNRVLLGDLVSRFPSPPMEAHRRFTWKLVRKNHFGNDHAGHPYTCEEDDCREARKLNREYVAPERDEIPWLNEEVSGRLEEEITEVTF